MGKFRGIFGLILIVSLPVLAEPAPSPPPAAEPPPTVEQLIRAGATAMAKKDYEEAIKRYGAAVSQDRNNARLWVVLGDAHAALSPKDVEHVRHARACWEQALAAAPDDAPALDRLFHFWSEAANLSSSSPDVFRHLRESALKLHAVDPHNSAAEIAISTAVIRPWLAGVETPEEEIRATITKLAALEIRYPDNPDLPMFEAQGTLRLAERERQREHPAEANRLIEQAVTIMTAAVKRSPKADMYFAAAQVAQVLEALAAGSAAAPQWRSQRNEYYDKARELCDLHDPLYVFINLAAARAVANQPERAEKILREVYSHKSDDPQVRLALAEQLATDPTKRAEAISLLDQPFVPSSLIGPRAYMSRELQMRTIIMATNLRLDRYAGATEQERAALLEKINGGINSVELVEGEGPRSLRLRGKLLKLQGQTIQAIQTLEKARSLADKQSDVVENQGDRIDRWEVIDLLARAYIETQQTGRAKALLTELVNRFPGYDAARILLAQTLIKEGRTDEAKPHVQYLKKHRPNDPDVIKLELQLLKPGAASISTTPASDTTLWLHR